VSRTAPYGWLGLGLVALVYLSLLGDFEAITRWATPIAWWGLILFLDALLSRVRGASPLLGRPGRLAGWCAVSLLFWLLFEGTNLHLRNWHYVGLPHPLWQRFLGYAVSFATVVPGVFLVAEALTEGRLFRGARGPRLPSGKGWAIGAIALGAFLVVFPLLVGETLAVWLYAPIWVGFFLLLDPLNRLLGAPSLTGDWSAGRYGRTLRLLAAGLLCGLLWESWNSLAAAKWVYTVPVAPGVRLFEMPLVGFLGFAPFALELFVLFHLAAAAWDALRGRPPVPSREPAFRVRERPGSEGVVA
jgi:hypothetical protein